jgi:hypothetical protein
LTAGALNVSLVRSAKNCRYRCGATITRSSSHRLPSAFRISSFLGSRTKLKPASDEFGLSLRLCSDKGGVRRPRSRRESSSSLVSYVRRLTIRRSWLMWRQTSPYDSRSPLHSTLPSEVLCMARCWPYERRSNIHSKGERVPLRRKRKLGPSRSYEHHHLCSCSSSSLSPYRCLYLYLRLYLRLYWC